MYRKSGSRWLKHVDFMFFDVLAMELALLTVTALWRGWGEPGVYVNIAWVLVLVNIFVVFLGDSYKGVLRRGYLQEFKAAFLHVIYVLALFLFYLYLAQSTVAYSRKRFIFLGFFYFLYTYIIRILWKKVLQKRGRKNTGRRSLVIITSSEECFSLWCTNVPKRAFTGYSRE